MSVSIFIAFFCLIICDNGEQSAGSYVNPLPETLSYFHSLCQIEAPSDF